MAHTGKLPKLSQFVLDNLKQMGFKQISGRPYEFIGSVASQVDDYGMAALLTVMPLRLQKDAFVISLEMNGEQVVKARIAKLDDIANLVGYAGVVRDILTTVDGKETHDNQNTTNRGAQHSNGSAER